MTKLRVGFDLDGVLLYNPVRIARMPIAILKRLFSKKRELKFYIPSSSFEQKIWQLGHLTSLFIVPGFDEIKKLAKEGKIEAYIITARYSFLEDDFKKWLFKMKINYIFKGTFLNTKNEQPHLFKQKMVEKLKLDIFVDDNWDIVDYLSKKTKTKILWVYNILDRFIDYPYKFPTLKKALEKIEANL